VLPVEGYTDICTIALVRTRALSVQVGGLHTDRGQVRLGDEGAELRSHEVRETTSARAHGEHPQFGMTALSLSAATC
jgi:hypothetical protein